MIYSDVISLIWCGAVIVHLFWYGYAYVEYAITAAIYIQANKLWVCTLLLINARFILSGTVEVRKICKHVTWFSHFNWLRVNVRCFFMLSALSFILTNGNSIIKFRSVSYFIIILLDPHLYGMLFFIHLSYRLARDTLTVLLAVGLPSFCFRFERIRKKHTKIRRL